jgi:hypothetical protein
LSSSRALAQQQRGRFAADLARWQLAAGDRAFGHHDCDLRARVGLRQRTVEVLQVRVQRDLAETTQRAVIGHAALDQQVLDLFARLQAIDQLLVQCQLRQVALHRGDFLRQGIGQRAQRGRGDATRLAGIGQHPLPDVVHPEQVGFLRFGRCRIQDVGFGRGLVFADLEQVHVNAELVLQALAEVLPVRGQAFQHHPALRHRVQVDLVRLRGQQVLALAVVVAMGDHLLLRGLDPGDGRGDLAQRCEAARLQVVQAQDHALDALVGARRVECAQQVAQAHFAAVVAVGGTRDVAAQRIAAELLHQAALRLDHQGRAFADRRQLAAAEHQPQHQDQQCQEQQVEHQPAGEVDRVPQADGEAGDGSATARFVHAGTPGEATPMRRVDVDMLAGRREALIRRRSP